MYRDGEWGWKRIEGGRKLGRWKGRAKLADCWLQ